MNTGAAALLWVLLFFAVIAGLVVEATTGIIIGLGSLFVGASVVLGACAIQDAINKFQS